jgi:biotin synthase
MKKVFLCSICNISSGVCNEDCKYCTQSTKYKAKIDRFYKKDIKDIVKEAKIAKENKAIGFCLVTSTKELDDKTLEFVIECAKAVKKEVEIKLIACNGTASIEALKELKNAGVEKYNHNLETSKNFYPQICTTHDWEERFQTCENVNHVGLDLVCGGIFGLGESIEDRISMLNDINKLNPMTVPINFYHPNKALPIENKIMDIEEAFEWIRKSKHIIGDKRLMIAGGRSIVFKEREDEIFKNGADAIIIGNYLTTNGQKSSKDLEMIERLGLEIAKSCKKNKMRLFIDGDALPNLLKPILLRAIQKYNIETIVISNKKISIGSHHTIKFIIVEATIDEADNKIVEMLNKNDLVITADIPLADRTISKNAHAIDHRGQTYTTDNIKQYLAMRNLMESIRESGEITKGPKPFTAKDSNNFANALNSFLQKNKT